MKKKKLLVLSAVCCAFAVALTGCQAALVSSDVTMYKDGGTKTITATVFADNALQAGIPDGTENAATIGNNSTYLLVTGDELAQKIKSYSALSDLDVKAKKETNGNTTLTLTYSFANIAEYNTKTKTLAKDGASDIEDATWTENADGTYTYKENCDNTQYSVDNLFESLWNDPEAFNPAGTGKDGTGTDANLKDYNYTHTCLYTILSVSASVGDKTQKVDINEYQTYIDDQDNNKVKSRLVELDYPDYLEVTGTPTDRAGASDKDDEGSSTGLIVGLSVGAAVVVVGAAVAAVIIVKKKKKS